jgi:hypothetical protein
MRQTFTVDALDGDATVAITVTITATVIGGADALGGRQDAADRRIAKEEAAGLVLDAVRDAVVRHNATVRA